MQIFLKYLVKLLEKAICLQMIDDCVNQFNWEGWRAERGRGRRRQRVREGNRECEWHSKYSAIPYSTRVMNCSSTKTLTILSALHALCSSVNSQHWEAKLFGNSRCCRMSACRSADSVVLGQSAAKLRSGYCSMLWFGSCCITSWTSLDNNVSRQTTQSMYT